MGTFLVDIFPLRLTPFVLQEHTISLMALLMVAKLYFHHATLDESVATVLRFAKVTVLVLCYLSHKIIFAWYLIAAIGTLVL